VQSFVPLWLPSEIRFLYRVFCTSRKTLFFRSTWLLVLGTDATTGPLPFPTHTIQGAR
jgi:hypothetical protein